MTVTSSDHMIDDALPTGREPTDLATRRLGALVARSRALTGVIAADGTPVYLSPAAVELHTGRRPDELSVSTGTDLIHPDDYEGLAGSFDVSLARPKEPIPVRYRTRHVDGSWRIIEGTYTNLVDDPDIAGVVLDVDDVTDRAEAEDALRASEARNRRVIDSLAEGIILTGEGGRILACNQAAVELFGLSAEEMMDHTSNDHWNLTRRDGSRIAPEDAPATKTRETGEPCRDVVMAAHRPNGESSWISASSVVIDVDDDGRPELVAVSLTDITALVESTAEIEHNERRFRTLIAKSSDVVTIIDPDLRVGYVGGAVEDILGYGVDELIGRDASELIHPDDLEPALNAVARTMTPGSGSEPLELRLLHAQGHWVSLEALGTDLMDDPLVGGIAVNLRDISERRRIEATLHAAQVRFEEAFQHAPIGIAMAGQDGRFFRVNPAFCQMLGYSNDELLGRSFKDLTHPDDLEHNLDLHDRTYRSGLGSYVLDKRYRRKAGDWIWCRVHVTVVKDADDAPLYSLGQIVDMTESRRFEERLAYEATHDGLTSLPLRNLLIDHLELALAGARRRSSEIAVLFIDLDHFKRVNDRLGHTAGDELLVLVAERLQSSVRDGDTPGRFGGDEFVIVCPDIGGASDALMVAERIRVALEAPFSVRGTEAFVGASVGVVVADGRADAGTLLKHADIAAYRAKERGRNRAELFDENLRSAVARRLDTESAFRHGLDASELVLHYQPVMSVRTGEIKGFEALVRWNRPGHGLVQPADFLTIAEETGLIVPMGLQVLRIACAQIADWSGRFPDGSSPWVSVNLSAGQLGQTDLVDNIALVLAESGASPRSLCIEITETLLMQDTPATIDTLKRLRELGVSLAIDDFGTGYSSLSYLRRLPVTVLKIDRSFVLELGLDPQGATIVASVIDLAHALGMECVAEGVENEVHLATLARLGCDEMQGFLFSPGVPAEEATALLGRHFLTPAAARAYG
jgi:diguanylate cyclase (GGDEF)-like protein/PAS domain S-box-containing protein